MKLTLAPDDGNGSIIAIGQSFKAAITTAIITGLFCILHLWLLIRHRAWFFHLMFFSAFCEYPNLAEDRVDVKVIQWNASVYPAEL